MGDASKLRWLFRPVDAAWLAAFRMMMGALLAWEAWRYFEHGWIEAYWIRPAYHFPYPGFEWLAPWPGNGMYVHFAALGLAATCMALGLFYRVASAAFAVGFLYVFLLDEATYLNHFYLIAWIAAVMAVLPAERLWSLDAWRRPGRASPVVPAWTLGAMRFLVGVPYFFGGIAKLHPDWLRGEPMRTWLGDWAAMPLLGPWLQNELAVWFFSLGGLAFDLGVVFLMLWPRTRMLGMLLALSFHLMNATLFRIGVFPWFMIAATLVFLPPDWPRRVLALFGVRSGPAHAPLAPPSPARARAIAAGLALFVLFHVLVPLRHFLYPGDAHWTEEGHRFSWHMMARTKQGDVVFVVTDPSGASEVVDPARHLTARQLRKMQTRPYMIHQFARWLADTRTKPGEPRPTVRAEAWAALNGREPQRFIDPQVDLASEPETIGPARWIVPLEQP
jgi:vitamin K-dependent gamma-carboxylase